MQLARALRLLPAHAGETYNPPRLGLVGAGGKTTALFQLARQLPPPVLVTASTHLGEHQVTAAEHLIARSPVDLRFLEAGIPETVLVITGPREQADNIPGRMMGLDPITMDSLHTLAERKGIALLVEADGSRQLPLKAPADHEPVLPGFVDTVVVVAGLSGLGKPLTNQWVHRPEIFSALSQLQPGENVTIEGLARLLSHPQGGVKGIPPGARRVSLLNQADVPEGRSAGLSLAQRLLPVYSSVVLAALGVQRSLPASAALVPGTGDVQAGAVFAVHERIAGIILAAGGATRFGRLKQLLPWRGEPFVRHAARSALQAGLKPVVVVTGAQAQAVRAALQGMDLVQVENPDWEAGQSSSLQAGLRVLPPETGAVIFLLADQPHVPVSLLRALTETHSETLSALVAPLVDGRRGNPVLFDRSTFPALMALRGDVGGRALFSTGDRFPISWVPWLDSSLLLDVDTPQDYRRLIDLDA